MNDRLFKSLLEPREFLWPKKGSRLLKPASDWRNVVAFHRHPVDRDVFLWSGYMLAGAKLIDAAMQNEIDRNSLIYPILFNYRQGLELAMKWVIDQYGHYGNISLTRAELNHGLWALWKKCKMVIVEIAGNDPKDKALDAVELIVKDFHEVDMTAESFRYSRHKDHRVITLPEGAHDLENIRSVMEAVNNFFGGVDCQLSYYTAT